MQLYLSSRIKIAVFEAEQGKRETAEKCYWQFTGVRTQVTHKAKKTTVQDHVNSFICALFVAFIFWMGWSWHMTDFWDVRSDRWPCTMLPNC